MLRKVLIFFTLIIFFSIKSYAEINEAQKKIIKSQVILIHEGMVSQEDVFKKAKLFDKEGVFGIGKNKLTQDEFQEYLDKESLHAGY